MPVVDGTRGFTAIHQNHDYLHVKKSTGGWRGPESDYNIDLIGDKDHWFSLNDSTHILTRNGMLPNMNVISLFRRFRTLPILTSELDFIRTPIREMEEMIVNIRDYALKSRSKK